MKHPDDSVSMVDISSRSLAARLLRELGPVLPVVAKAAQSQAGAIAWVDAWARQIEAAQLTAQEIAGGLSRLDKAPPDEPFGWRVFISLCRPVCEKQLRECFSAACKAAHSGDFGELAPDVWEAGCRLGWGRIKNSAFPDVEWRVALLAARDKADLAIRAAQPQAGQARIEMSMSARAEARQAEQHAVAKQRVAAFAALGLEPPNRAL